MNSSSYIESERKEFSLYVLTSRAIPYAADGLKAAARRAIWTAKDGKKYKSTTLAGATMPIHPHASPEGVINTLAAPHSNNIPLLKGDGAFGTLLKPGAFGASRYTSITISQFTKDVMFRDIEIIPLQDNYDGTLQEPTHFLPLVPIALLNPQEGIAVGFACSILPRSLENIIQSQLAYLADKKVIDVYPGLVPSEQYCEEWIEGRDGNGRWVFHGTYETINSTTLKITKLPYGVIHEKYDQHLMKLLDEGIVVNYEDNSRDYYDIVIKFKKGILSKMNTDQILDLLNLSVAIPENMNVIDFDGQHVLATNYVELIKLFTDWRLKWYLLRYERLANLLQNDIQFYKDVLLAIEKNIGGMTKKIKSRSELKELLTKMGIVYVDRIADLPIYRFTLEEKQKVEQKIKEALALLKKYNLLIKKESLRKEQYELELTEILHNYKQGKYDK